MCPDRRLDLLTGAHIEQAFVQLADLIGREIHILAVLHQLVKRFLLLAAKEQMLLGEGRELTLGMRAFVGCVGERDLDLLFDRLPSLRLLLPDL